MIKGYKVFKSDWTCRDFKYEVGKRYTMDEKPIICRNGFHFCQNLKNCFNYYDFDPQNKIAEIIAHGEVDEENNKSCTNDIEIVREITWEEVLRLVNSGTANCGFSNSGDYNSGNWNSGNCNSGDWNSGNCNSGNRNSGNYNSGNRNSGDCNSGNRNSGDWNSGNRNSGNWNSGNWNSGNRNSGDCNSGDYNSGNYNHGCFNTNEPTIRLFNKPTNWKLRDWHESFARKLLSRIEFSPTTWINDFEMTDKEKQEHQEFKTTGGYLRENEIEGQKWWDELNGYEKECIKSLPNFDEEIFKKILNIKNLGD